MKINKYKLTVYGLFLLYFLQFVDMLLTGIGVSMYGSIVEGNPLVKYSIETFGTFLGLSVIKIPGLFFILFIYFYINTYFSNKLFYIVMFLNLIYILSSCMWVVFLWRDLFNILGL